MIMHLRDTDEPFAWCGVDGRALIITEFHLQSGLPAFKSNASAANAEVCEVCLKIFEEKRRLRGYTPCIAFGPQESCTACSG